MRIVVLDGHTLNPGDNPWTDLEGLASLTVHARTAPGDVVGRAAGAEIVLTNKTRLTAAHFAALPKLGLVAVLATGYDVVDVAAARERGVVVSNVPEYGTESVAQHAIALLLELTQRVGLHDEAVRRGEWAACPDFSFWKKAPLELAGCLMGVVGFGRIGRRVGEIAAALGMRVLAASRQRPARVPDGVSWRSLDELFAEADVVSLHCPATAETIGLAGARRLALMKPTAFLVNTARGSLVDETALAEALGAGRLAGAALDVASTEPLAKNHPLLAAPNCVLTPHLAWASLAARRRLMEATVANVRAFLAGSPIHVVT